MLFDGPLCSSATFSEDLYQGDWATPQRSGSCYFKCVQTVTDYVLKRLYAMKQPNGSAAVLAPRATSLHKRVATAVRVEALRRLDCALGPCCLTIKNSDAQVARIMGKQTARAVTKAVSAGRCSQPEVQMALCNEVYSSICDKLRTAVVADRQIRPPSLGEMLATWDGGVDYVGFGGLGHLLHRGSTVLMDHLGGAVEQAAPPPTMDFSTLEGEL